MELMAEIIDPVVLEPGLLLTEPTKAQAYMHGWNSLFCSAELLSNIADEIIHLRGNSFFFDSISVATLFQILNSYSSFNEFIFSGSCNFYSLRFIILVVVLVQWNGGSTNKASAVTESLGLDQNACVNNYLF